MWDGVVHGWRRCVELSRMEYNGMEWSRVERSGVKWSCSARKPPAAPGARLRKSARGNEAAARSPPTLFISSTVASTRATRSSRRLRSRLGPLSLTHTCANAPAQTRTLRPVLYLHFTAAATLNIWECVRLLGRNLKPRDRLISRCGLRARYCAFRRRRTSYEFVRLLTLVLRPFALQLLHDGLVDALLFVSDLRY